MTYSSESAANAATAAPLEAAEAGTRGAAVASPAIANSAAARHRSAPAATASSFFSTPSCATGTSTSGSSAKIAAEAGSSATCTECRDEQDDDGVMEADVVIAGTGIAGCLIAAALARRGVKVVQIDGGALYGGVYKSLKLSELCDWVRAERQEQKSVFTANAGAAPSYDVTAPLAPATRTPALDIASVAVAPPATAAASSPTDPELTKWRIAGAAGAPSGEIMVCGTRKSFAVAPSDAAAAAAVTSAAAGGLTISEAPPVPSQRDSGKAEACSGVRELLQKRRVREDADSRAAAAATGTSSSGLNGKVVPPSTPASLAAHAAVPVYVDGAESHSRREWISSCEDSPARVSFCLRCEARASAICCDQASSFKRSSPCSRGPCGRPASSTSVAPKSFSSDRVASPASASLWGNSEHVFFSFRSFSFFPFVAGDEAQHVSTQLRNRRKEIAASSGGAVACPEACPEEDGAACDGREARNKSTDASDADGNQDPLLAFRGADAADFRRAAEAGAGTRHPPSVDYSTKMSSKPLAPPSSLEGKGSARSTDVNDLRAVEEEDIEGLKEKLLKSTRYNIDLIPRVLYSSSAIGHILVACGAAKYLEFRPIDAPVYVGEMEADFYDEVGSHDQQLSGLHVRERTADSFRRRHEPHQLRRKGKQEHCCQWLSSAMKLKRPAVAAVSETSSKASATPENPHHMNVESDVGPMLPFFAASQEKPSCFFVKDVGTHEQAIPSQDHKEKRPLVTGFFQRREERQRKMKGGKGDGGGAEDKPRGHEEEEEAKRVKADVEGELPLVQTPLTRSAIFSSSLLTPQEKRLLMNFVSKVAAPKLNSQFLSAAGLWKTSTQAINSALGRKSTPSKAAEAAIARPVERIATPLGPWEAGPLGQDARSFPGRGKLAASTEKPACPLKGDIKNMPHNIQPNLEGSNDGVEDVEDVSWEAYLDSYQLTEKLQRYLSYGVCVSDFPLWSQCALHRNTRQSLFLGDSAGRRRTGEGREEDAEKVTNRQYGVESGEEGIGRADNGGQSGEELCKRRKLTASDGRARLLAFVQSVGLYENHSGAWLYPIYGTGDLPQALARAASLSGTVYMLRANVVELKIVCSRTPASPSICTFPCPFHCCPKHRCPDSLLSSGLAELPVSSSGRKTAALPCQSAQKSIHSSETELFEFEPAVGERKFCGDRNAFFLLHFHRALMEAEAVEVKLETGFVVRTRLILFEADALPPLHQRLCACMPLAGFRCSCKGGFSQSVNQVYGHTDFVPLANAQGREISPPSGKAEMHAAVNGEFAPKSFGKAQQARPDGGKEAPSFVRKTMGACSKYPPPTGDYSSEQRMHAVELSSKESFAQDTKTQLFIHLGELLFPVLRAASEATPPKKRKREDRGTEEEDVRGRLGRNAAAGAEALPPDNSSFAGQQLSSSVDEREKLFLGSVQNSCSERGTRTDAPGAFFKSSEEKNSTIDENPADCSALRTVHDYYTQASCHLIAVCRRSVLNGPGFRIGVCTVRPKNSPAFSKTAGVARAGSPSSAFKSLSTFEDSPGSKPTNSATTIANTANAGESAATSSTAPAVTGRTPLEVAASTQGAGNTGAGAAYSAGGTDSFNAACAEMNTFDTTAALRSASIMKDICMNASPGGRATPCDGGRPCCVKRAGPGSCLLDQNGLPDKGHILRRAGRGPSAGDVVTVNNTCVSNAPGVGRLSMLRTDECGEPATTKTSCGGTAVAWPVVALQTDLSCGTVPAGFVLLHLSHVDGLGVKACGCSFHGMLGRKCCMPKTQCGGGGSNEFCGKGYARARPAATRASDIYDAGCGVATCQSGAAAVRSKVEATTLPLAGKAVEREAPQTVASAAMCASDEKSTLRPCAMLMNVLRRLLERGHRRGAAAQDCVFVSGYVLSTIRSDIEKRLQAWQLKRFRGVLGSFGRPSAAVRRNSGKVDETGGTRTTAAADAAGQSTATASGASRTVVDASLQQPATPGKASAAPLSPVDRKTSRSGREQHIQSTEVAEGDLYNAYKHVKRGRRTSRASVKHCGCLILPAVPATPLLFLLEEPKACRKIVEALLDQQINDADLIPAHAGQEVEEAAQELQRLSAPYERLNEIIASVR